MKHFLPSLIFLMLPFSAKAEEVEIGGLYYDLNSEKLTAEVVINDQAEGDIVIPESVEYQGNEYQVIRIGDCAFSYCSGLYSVKLPGSITSIGLEGFSYCTELESIEMSANITEISEAAFWGCSSLKSVELPDNIEYLGESVFEDCKAMTSIKLPSNLNTIGVRAFWGCSSLDNVELPKNLTEIYEYAFWGCRSLKSITFPASLKSIGCVSFVGCDMLGVIKCEGTKPAQIEINDYIAQKFFMSWTDQTIIYVPAGAEENYKTADVWNTFDVFRGYNEGDVIETDVIRTVNVGGLNYAVSDFNHLAKVTANNGAEGEVEISSSINFDDEEYVVKFIGDLAFENSPYLSTVDIPETIEGIGQLAFSYCPELTDVCIMVPEPFELYEYVFDTSLNSNMTLYVPVGSKTAYESAKNWNSFSNIVEKEYTAIESVSVDDNADDKVYDIQGRRAATPAKGLYIKNGKKVIL